MFNPNVWMGRKRLSRDDDADDPDKDADETKKIRMTRSRSRSFAERSSLATQKTVVLQMPLKQQSIMDTTRPCTIIKTASSKLRGRFMKLNLTQQPTSIMEEDCNVKSQENVRMEVNSIKNAKRKMSRAPSSSSPAKKKKR